MKRKSKSNDFLNKNIDIEDLLAHSQEKRKARDQFILRAKIPPHPNTIFDEDKFVQLLAYTTSLSIEEKERIIEGVGSFSQFQIDELIIIFEEDYQKFIKLERMYHEQMAERFKKEESQPSNKKTNPVNDYSDTIFAEPGSPLFDEAIKEAKRSNNRKNIFSKIFEESKQEAEKEKIQNKKNADKPVDGLEALRIALAQQKIKEKKKKSEEEQLQWEAQQIQKYEKEAREKADKLRRDAEKKIDEEFKKRQEELKEEQRKKENQKNERERLRKEAIREEEERKAKEHKAKQKKKWEEEQRRQKEQKKNKRKRKQNKEKFSKKSWIQKIEEAYQLLELEENSTKIEVKEQYEYLVAAHHPDQYATRPKYKARAEEKMKKINSAYDVLKEAGKA